MTSTQAGQISHALVEFSLHGVFPEEGVSSTRMVVDHLGPALESLAAAKFQLEVRLLKALFFCIWMLMLALSGRYSQDQRRNRLGRKPVGRKRKVTRTRHQPNADLGERDCTKVGSP